MYSLQSFNKELIQMHIAWKIDALDLVNSLEFLAISLDEFAA